MTGDPPRHLDIEQSSPQWIAARLGVPTASEFKRILTAKGRLSASRTRYYGELLAEYCLGYAISEFYGSGWTERGQMLEPQALSAYELATDVMPARCGIFLRDFAQQSGGPITVGASPDALAGDDGLIELKCPSPGVHCMYLAEDRLPPEYVMQVQGQMWVTGREWVDFMSYHPDLPPLILRIAPDPDLQGAMDDALPKFLKDLAAGRERMREMGAVLTEELGRGADDDEI